MTTMEVAMRKVMKVPPRTERIFNYVKDHPDVTAATVRKALKMEASSVSSLLCQLEQRKMVSSKKEQMRVSSSNGKSAIRDVAHYSAIIAEYELLPAPKKKPTPSAKQEKAIITVVPVERKIGPSAVSQTIDEFIERLTIGEARRLHQRLDAMFRN